MDLFSYILPFVGFIVDASVKRAFFISAKMIFMTAKIFIILVYLVAYVLAIQKTEEDKFYYIMVACQILFPIFIMSYWGLLIRGKLK